MAGLEQERSPCDYREKLRRTFHIVWPAAIGSFLGFVEIPVYYAFGRWWVVGVSAVALGMELVSLWRLNVLFKELSQESG